MKLIDKGAGSDWMQLDDGRIPHNGQGYLAIENLTTVRTSFKWSSFMNDISSMDSPDTILQFLNTPRIGRQCMWCYPCFLGQKPLLWAFLMPLQHQIYHTLWPRLPKNKTNNVRYKDVFIQENIKETMTKSGTKKQMIKILFQQSSLCMYNQNILL